MNEIWIGMTAGLVACLGLACGDDGSSNGDDDDGDTEFDTFPPLPTITTTSTTTTDSSTATTATTSTSGSTGEDSTGSTGGPPPPACGDGNLDDGEVCDDGNTDPGDTCTPDCQADSCVVPDTHATLDMALADNGCTVIYMQPDEYAVNAEIQRDVTIEGLDGGTVTLDGSAAGSTLTVFLNQVVTLRNLTITGGSAEEGGGIRNGGDLTVESCVVTTNAAVGTLARGGGIYSIGPLSVTDSTISDNTVSGGAAGGAVFGGGLYANGADATIGGTTTISGNGASATGLAGIRVGGGGLYMRGALLTVGGDITIQNNTVTVDSSSAGFTGFGGAGAGVMVQEGTLQMDAGVTVTGNTVSVSGTDPGDVLSLGGGVYVQDSDATLDGPITLTNNGVTLTAANGTAAGGGLFAEAGGIEVNSVNIDGNSATATGNDNAQEVFARGAGVHFARSEMGTSTFSLLDCMVTNNTADAQSTGTSTSEGGGLFLAAFLDGASVSGTLERSTLAGNRAEGETLARGGGVALVAQGDAATANVAVQNSTVSANTLLATGTAQGAGMLVFADFGTSSMTARMRHVTIADNTLAGGGTTEGGGIQVDDGTQMATTTLEIGGSILYGSDDSDCTATAGVTTTTTAANLWGDLGNCSFDTNGSIVGMNPNLAALALLGGQTEVRIPAVGSPAIDVLAAADCDDVDGNALVQDQRGETRPANNLCDLGSVERQAGD